jgi:hypothetical protein
MQEFDYVIGQPMRFFRLFLQEKESIFRLGLDLFKHRKPEGLSSLASSQCSQASSQYSQASSCSQVGARQEHPAVG